MFPTKLALKTAKEAKLGDLMPTDIDIHYAMADFQQVAAVSEFDEAIIVFNAHLKPGAELSETHRKILEKVYEFTQVEVKGILLGGVGKIFQENRVVANQLAAARMITALVDDPDSVSESDVKRLVMNFNMGNKAGAN
jgi:hypothetical protein